MLVISAYHPTYCITGVPLPWSEHSFMTDLFELMGNFQFGSFWGGSYSNVGHGSQIIPMWVGLAISDACIV